jgi:hypothetical protein
MKSIFGQNFENISKESWANIALYLALRLSEKDDFNQAVDIVEEEYKALQSNGIIKSKRKFVKNQEQSTPTL